MKVDTRDRTLKLISEAFGVAVEPERFDDLLAAWDNWFDALAEDPALAFAEVSPLFDDALSTSAQLNAGMSRTPLEQSPVPTVLLDEAGQILAKNAHATALFEEESLDPTQLLSQRAASDGRDDQGRHNTFRLAGAGARRSYLAVETQVTTSLQAVHPNARSALFLSLMDWNDAFETELARHLDLSSAELKVARGLLEGRTAQEISGDLGRSLATIRSHIKALLQKTGARRQTELVQFLTIMRQVTDVKPAVAGQSDACDFEQVHLTNPTGRLQVVRYGKGQPLIYFTTSSCPEETQPFRAALRAAGFSVLAPVRPGFRESDAVKGDASEALLENWLDTLLTLAGPCPLIVGHREGGILAARAVQRIVSTGGSVAGLALISTGAPVKDLAHFEDIPADIRRSFLSAHIAAPALRLGYQTAARIFRASSLGRHQIIRFFHKDSPADKDRMKDPVYQEITRDFLDFCFDDPNQIVRDVADWGKDWSDALDLAVKNTPTVFFHGSEHVFHDIANIEALTSGGSNPTLVTLEGAGQLALYEHPKTIVRHLLKLAQN